MSNRALRFMFRGRKDEKYPELEKDLCYVHKLQNEVVQKSIKKTGAYFADRFADATDDAAERKESAST